MKKEISAVIDVKENRIRILRVNNIDYISLTDLAKYQKASDPSFIIKNWLRRISTIDYIGLWEQLSNNNFNLVEFDQIKFDKLLPKLLDKRIVCVSSSAGSNDQW